MKTLITVALLTLTGAAHAGAYDHAACELVLEDYRGFRNPADRAADFADTALTERTLKIRDQRTETYLRGLGGWDLLDDYAGVSFETTNWLDENRTSITAMPAKAARAETNAYIRSLCE